MAKKETVTKKANEAKAKKAVVATKENDCAAIGLELGTSTSKFCVDDTMVVFSSVVGDPLTSKQEKTWRLMNRSKDDSWIRNLAIYDDSRKSWRYVGAMTRNSAKQNWFTSKGVLQNFDDAYVAFKAGLFLLNAELKESKKKTIKNAGLGFGITVHTGEDVADSFFNYIKGKLSAKGDKKYIVIKARNVATEEEKEIKINIEFTIMQYQAYGAYMAFLFGKFNMKIYNTYIIDIGHGTWIKLPVIDNEADVLLADSFGEGMFTITKNISNSIFEMSSQKFKIPEQRIMEKIPKGDLTIEVPGSGVYDFKGLLDDQCEYLAQIIVQQASNDLKTISAKGEAIDYFIIIGGGAHLLFDKLKTKMSIFFEWDEKTAKERILSPDSLNIDPRYINCLGFMLLARDHIALESGEDVNPDFELKRVITDYKSAQRKQKS